MQPLQPIGSLPGRSAARTGREPNAPGSTDAAPDTMSFKPPDFLTPSPAKPWLIIGKGPSSAGFRDFAAFTCLTLNHACRIVPEPAVCFFMDHEAFLDCLPDIPTTARVALPWHPHIRMAPTALSLEDLGVHALLGDRLGVFNSTTSPMPPDPRFPVVRVVHFSGDGAVNLLAHHGIRVIHTLGIDGGRRYAPGFDRGDLLANGRRSFNQQFLEFARTTRECGVTIRRVRGRAWHPLRDRPGGGVLTRAARRGWDAVHSALRLAVLPNAAPRPGDAPAPRREAA